MIIGIPKESWRDEQRVALTPAGVHALMRDGHTVLVQVDAGSGCGFSDDAYAQAGAQIVFRPEEIFGRADIVTKVMPPAPHEITELAPNRTIFSFIQFDLLSLKQIPQLMEKRSTVVGYNLIADAFGNLPVLMTMSEIAGMLLPQLAGRFLETQGGGRGVLLSGVAGIPASNVVILGAGVVGSTAAQAFVGLGADVMVMDQDLSRLRRIERITQRAVNTAVTSSYNIQRYIQYADVLIGAVMIHGRQSPHVVTEAHVQSMRRGSVILDVSIDQGGCIETSRPTTHSDPTFVRHDIIHYAVPNIPTLVARTASHALNNVILPYVRNLATQGSKALGENEALRRGLLLYQGRCTLAEVAEHLGLATHDIGSLIEED